MKALIITGLGNRDNAQYMQLDLQNRGYDVDTRKWHDTSPIGSDYEYVIAHSAGSAAATLYAQRHPNTVVFVLGAIVNVDLPNIVSVGEYSDPVAVAGLLLSGQTGFDVHTSEFEGFNPHSKNAYYDAIKNRIVDKSGSWDTTRVGSLQRGE